MITKDLTKLLARHRQSGIAIDSNLLLLLWIGVFDRSLIQRFKRTQKYTETDFDLLVSMMSHVRLLVTTPNILTEVGNLAGQLPEQLAGEFRFEMGKIIQQMSEEHLLSKMVVAENCFISLGLTDSTLVMLAKKKILILTDDLPLYLKLASEKRPVINFTYIRSAAYRWKS